MCSRRVSHVIIKVCNQRLRLERGKQLFSNKISRFLSRSHILFHEMLITPRRVQSVDVTYDDLFFYSSRSRSRISRNNDAASFTFSFSRNIHELNAFVKAVI